LTVIDGVTYATKVLSAGEDYEKWTQSIGEAEKVFENGVEQGDQAGDLQDSGTSLGETAQQLQLFGRTDTSTTTAVPGGHVISPAAPNGFNAGDAGMVVLTVLWIIQKVISRCKG
jgi:hypothetical protein